MSHYVNQEELHRLEPQWRALLASGGPTFVFLSPTWLRIWWEEFAEGHQLLLFGVRKGSQLDGVAALMREGQRLSFAGDSQICDYMDLTIAPGREEGVIISLLRHLAEEPWQELILWGLPEFSPTLQILPPVAQSLGYSIEMDLEDTCPGIALPATWDEYLGSLPKKSRHELRRKLRRLAEGGRAELETLQNPDQVAAALDDFLRLHRASRTEKALFMTEQMAGFFKRMVTALAQEGLVRLQFLSLNGVRTAGVLCFQGPEKLLLYNSGYDPTYAPFSVGLLSKALSLRQAILEGQKYFDFLRGAEPYKYDLGAQNVNVYRCVIRRN